MVTLPVQREIRIGYGIWFPKLSSISTRQTNTESALPFILRHASLLAGCCHGYLSGGWPFDLIRNNYVVVFPTSLTHTTLCNTSISGDRGSPRSILEEGMYLCVCYNYTLLSSLGMLSSITYIHMYWQLTSVCMCVCTAEPL